MVFMKEQINSDVVAVASLPTFPSTSTTVAWLSYPPLFHSNDDEPGRTRSYLLGRDEGNI
jgi:hypothetical protein